MNGISICITVKDERGAMEALLRGLSGLPHVQEVIVVEGGSKDGTPEEIDRVLSLLGFPSFRHSTQPGAGQGDAIRFGFSLCRGDILVLYEGDGTSRPEDIESLTRPLREGHLDLTLGNRFDLSNPTLPMPLHRRFGNRLFAWWASLILGKRLDDVLSGNKAITRAGYERARAYFGHLGVEDRCGDLDLLFSAAKAGLRIGQVGMGYLPRTSGESKTSTLRHGWHLARLLLRASRMYQAPKGELHESAPVRDLARR